MGPMATAKGAKLLQLQPLGLGLLVLGFAIVLAFAFGALQSDNFTHVSLLFSREKKPESRSQNPEEGTRSFRLLNSEF
jgi:hypothetical protein